MNAERTGVRLTMTSAELEDFVDGVVAEIQNDNNHGRGLDSVRGRAREIVRRKAEEMPS